MQVAQLAGIPQSITVLAKEKGLELEDKLKVMIANALNAWKTVSTFLLRSFPIIRQSVA